MPKEIFVGNIKFEANANNVVDVLEQHIKGKVIRCELAGKKNANPLHINGGYAFVTLDDDDAVDLLSRGDYNAPFCMTRSLNISEAKNKGKRKKHYMEPLTNDNGNEPIFQLSSIELGNWAGQLPIVNYKRHGKKPLPTQRWTFLWDWTYPSYYVKPTVCISKESDAILIDGFTLPSDLKNGKRIKIPIRSLIESNHGILLDVKDCDNGFISLYISLKCSPILLRKTNKFNQSSKNTRLMYCITEEEEWVRTTDWTGCVNAFGKFLVYRLTFTENLEAIRRSLNHMSIPGIPTRIPKCLVSCEEIPKDAESYLKGIFDLLPFSICFKLESLISYGIITIHEIMEYKIGDKLIDLIYDEKETIAWHALNQMTIQRWDPADDRYNRRPVEIFQIALKNFRGEYDEWHPANPNIKLKDNNRCVWINYATVTPVKIYFNGPEYESSNRILRRYSEYADRFIRVTFKEENLDRLFNEQDTDLYDLRIKKILKNGFMVAGRQYEFLAFSSSQLRECSCWFVSPDKDFNANSIRESMGDFSAIKAPALYAARMGQCFTSTISTLELEVGQIKKIPDIKRNGFEFSDGCGNISPDLANLAAKHYWGTQHDDEIPSVFQFRFGGYKGVVSVNPVLEGNVICIRPSQIKFEAPISTNLEIVKAVKNPLPAHLNRQIITLLSSLGVKDDIFIKLQNNARADIDSIIRDPQKAREIVKRSLGTRECTHVTRTILSMIEALMEDDDEPYLKGLLECKRIFALKSLRYKARIPVPQGYLLFGILDETGILEPDQIYIQTSTIISENTFNTVNSKIQRKHKVWTGPAVIARNPSLHPGDIRVVRAVDVPKLNHLKNCVVFSQKGEKPLPNCLSGGDLDGDEFFVCFDERIFPETESEPMDYSPPKRKTIEDRALEISDIRDFFIDFMKNDRVGRIGSLHLALADFYTEGVYHPKCLKLAELHSMAVDFNKTGVPVTEPLPILDEYPDFMENKKKKEYVSQKILGKLYKNINIDNPRDDQLLNYKFGNISPKKEFLAQGYENYLEEAEISRDTYNSEIRNLMKKFRVKTEPEIITSNLLNCRRIDGRKTQDIRESISGTISFITHKYRKHFLVGLSDNINQYADDDTYNVNIPVTNETKAKASAWYYVTYDDDQYLDTSDDKRLLSFAWTVADILLNIREENMLYVL
ncbi:RdRP-domain-containing protein [Gigaspora margarita]|uniref:RNA-dependent RNA polymerase n=1 Tax=Gigaspora margarita TaxID=4874 RepID=A0A8H4ESV0_GIGMA|nr:RdRP-domain-containing protein [Gigaspora margarita]